MDNRYTIKKKIGEGGFGTVFLAYDHRMDREVAIKRVRTFDDQEMTQESCRQLLKEASSLASIQHPNILTVFDVGCDKEGPYVVMELVSGCSLDKIIANAPLTFSDFHKLAIQTQEALICAHQVNLLHRDIKPANIMISWLPSGKFQVKLMDFGLSKLSEHPSQQTICQPESVMGSIYFMSPEQFEHTPLDASSDLYSMGCVYYYVLTGTYAFNGETQMDVIQAHINHEVKPLAELRPDLPEWLCAWVMWHINRDPQYRPASAQEALDLFRYHVDKEKTISPAPSGALPHPHQDRRNQEATTSGRQDSARAVEMMDDPHERKRETAAALPLATRKGVATLLGTTTNHIHLNSNGASAIPQNTSTLIARLKEDRANADTNIKAEARPKLPEFIPCFMKTNPPPGRKVSEPVKTAAKTGAITPRVIVGGSIGIDHVKTPDMEARNLLGGSAVYAALAAAFHIRPVALLGIVGQDFPEEHLATLERSGVVLDGLEHSPKESFTWSGEYHADMEERTTHRVGIHVLENWRLRVPENLAKADVVVCANMPPENQLAMLEQTGVSISNGRRGRFVMADTMSLWIEIANDGLHEVLTHLDLIVLNKNEACELSGASSLMHAVRIIQRKGPRFVLLNLREFGAMLFSPGGETFHCGACLMESKTDPTGTGDTLLGAIAGYIAAMGTKDLDEAMLRRAVAMGSVLASFASEAFSTKRIEALGRDEFDLRAEKFRASVHW